MQLAGEPHRRNGKSRPGRRGPALAHEELEADESSAGAARGGTRLLPGAAPEEHLPGNLKVTGPEGWGLVVASNRSAGRAGSEGGQGGVVRPSRQHAPRSGLLLRGFSAWPTLVWSQCPLGGQVHSTSACTRILARPLLKGQ